MNTKRFALTLVMAILILALSLPTVLASVESPAAEKPDAVRVAWTAGNLRFSCVIRNRGYGGQYNQRDYFKYYTGPGTLTIDEPALVMSWWYMPANFFFFIKFSRTQVWFDPAVNLELARIGEAVDVLYVGRYRRTFVLLQDAVYRVDFNVRMIKLRIIFSCRRRNLLNGVLSPTRNYRATGHIPWDTFLRLFLLG
jgi:hypothetical protein